MVLPPEHSTLGLSHLHHRVSAVTFHLPNDKAVLTQGTAVKTLLTFKIRQRNPKANPNPDHRITSTAQTCDRPAPVA